MIAAMFGSTPKQPDPELEAAKRRLARLEARAERVILVMTVEQAILARKLVREAGKRRA